MAQSIPGEGLPQVTLVVLGAQGVGKSTFIQNSFDLRSSSNSAFEVKKMSLDDVVYLVLLVEISLDDVVVTESNGIKWPKSLKGFDLPPIDGVLALYDVTNQESITGIPDILRWSPSLPFFILSILPATLYFMQYPGCRILSSSCILPTHSHLYLANTLHT